MKRLTKEQQKIIYIAAGVSIFIIFVWRFIFVPQNKRLMQIKNELKSLEFQIVGINNIVGDRELSEVTRELSEKFNKSKKLISIKEEDIINSLSEEARRLKVSVRNITPVSQKESDYQVAGFRIKEVVISMDLSGDFQAIGKYLDVLRNDFPALVQINKLDIKGKGQGEPKLDSSLQISAYLAK